MPAGRTSAKAYARGGMEPLVLGPRPRSSQPSRVGREGWKETGWALRVPLLSACRGEHRSEVNRSQCAR